MATTILPITNYNFDLDVEDGEPVFTFDAPDNSEGYTSYYTNAKKYRITTSVDGDEYGDPTYPLIHISFNGMVIDVDNDLSGQLEPNTSDQSVYIDVEYGKMTSLYVGDRLIERYDFEWLDNNIMVVVMQG